MPCPASPRCITRRPARSGARRTPPLSQTAVSYDVPYALFALRTVEYVDAQVALATQALIDYQSQAPWQLTDSNGVVQQVLYDPRGSVAAQSVFKPAEADGPIGDEDLADYMARRSQLRRRDRRPGLLPARRGRLLFL